MKDFLRTVVGSDVYPPMAAPKATRACRLEPIPKPTKSNYIPFEINRLAMLLDRLLGIAPDKTFVNNPGLGRWDAYA
jgi:hypothetical protein